MAEPQAIHLKDYLPPAYLVDDVALKFDLDDHATRVSARLKMRRHPQREAGLPLELFGTALRLTHIAIEGQPLDEDEYRLDAERLVIAKVPERFELTTEVIIDPAANTALEGLYRSSSMFCTQCEPEGFRRITYYPDRPDVMATFTTTVIGDRERLPVLLSNGNPTESGELPNGRHFVTWRDPFPKPSYLFALVAGALEKVEDHFTTVSGRQVTLQIWVERENLDKTEFAMGALKRAMKWDEEAYGREYDLDLFMIVAVNDFNMGAMENKGLNIFNSSAVLANPATTVDANFQRVEGIVAHEYFHNWSGNRVTCRDWFQLALKEGFTVFRDQSFSADVNSAPVKRIEDVSVLRTMQFAEDAGPTAHPVRPESFIEISNFYTLTVYEKGAEIVRMLRQLLGAERFRTGADLYFSRFDGQAVRVEDFVSSMSEAGDVDLTRFMRWYAQAGTPVLDVEGEYDAKAQVYRLKVRQHTPATPGQPAERKLPLHLPLRLGLLDAGGAAIPLWLDGESRGTDTVVELFEAEHEFRFERVPSAPVPSLLRGFSAPVKLRFPYDREQLALLVKYDEDGFNRWDAGQRLALAAIEEVMLALQAGAEPRLDPTLLDVFTHLLDTPSDDLAVLAEMLKLPSEAYIAGEQEAIDIDAIHQARRFVTRALGEALEPRFRALFEANQSEAPYAPSFEQIAQRSLRNVALGYLCATGGEKALHLAQHQFEQDRNMTDVRAALTLLAHSDAHQLGDPAVKAFGERWAHDPLVMDQWFAIQVTRPQPDVLDRVRFLMRHPAFSIKNPNKVRALIGAFANLNRVNFHRLDGEGYRLVADVVIELNRLNPDIAARIVTPLTRFQRLDAKRQSLMRAELERIRREPLSRNLFEVIEKALA
ncbi:aminopeptidase N [Halotalea alkalilenta]|uniref:Aminopeptidase N n=1 Tax=Halotalea alkalilenta TaxID=376489 RepID=A0A172YG69_9GAMM|nr:aminopeptidase N [Halotalea alkalilenta]ANF58279.1 aminopeptidase N [Halotalea alkalilenta]